MQTKWILGACLGISLFAVCEICGNAKEVSDTFLLCDIDFTKSWNSPKESWQQELFSYIDVSLLKKTETKQSAKLELADLLNIDEILQEIEEIEPKADLEEYDFILAFAGDVNFADDWNTMEYYRQQEGDISKCIDPLLIEKMRDADLFCLNLEFCLSSKGTPLENKYYTFRAEPSHVKILTELGVDVANLANNHAYDYGEEAFLEMLSILKEEEIAYIGGGSDASEAQRPYYFEKDGKKLAIITASRAEKMILTPEATENSSGIFRCYDTTRLLEVVKEAKEEADFVVAYIHWGTEYSEVLEEAQINGAYALVDAGVDVVLGAHPHCLQGIEYYKGKPILYSLGNYWFNEKSLDSILVELHFYGNKEEQHIELILVPAKQENFYTRLLSEKEDAEEWKNHLLQMSSDNVQIEENGSLKERK